MAINKEDPFGLTGGTIPQFYFREPNVKPDIPLKKEKKQRSDKRKAKEARLLEMHQIPPVPISQFDRYMTINDMGENLKFNVNRVTTLVQRHEISGVAGIGRNNKECQRYRVQDVVDAILQENRSISESNGNYMLEKLKYRGIPTSIVPDQWITINDAVKKFGINQKTIKKWSQDGKFPLGIMESGVKIRGKFLQAVREGDLAREIQIVNDKFLEAKGQKSTLTRRRVSVLK